MKTISALFLLLATTALADPQLSTWQTTNSRKYARVYLTDSDATSSTTYTTWSNPSGTQNQSLPVYAGVQQIAYSDSWIYIKTSGLGGHIMGPWYDNAARSARFVNAPVNQNTLWRLPRTATLGTPPTTKTQTSGSEAAVGYLVDGVAMFDCTDGFSWSGSAEAGGNTGQWHRDAYVNEGITLDYGNTHQQNTGMYHNHANPLALRYLLGDNVAYDSSTKKYAEAAGTPTKHSPLLGWMRDGYPIYGPYGYSSALDASSGVRRMVGGFVLRSGTTPGVDNLTSTGRTALPAWATRNNGNIAATGPTVGTTYPLGRYIEDWAYLGDLIKSGSTYYQQGTDFDLNEYNVRYCVTPEFPQGTYAYFMCIDASGAPQFPYHCNRYFFGTPRATTVTSITESVTSTFTGAAAFQETASMSGVNTTTGDVTLSWTSVEGGSYKISASPDLSTWSTLATAQPATANSTTTTVVESNATSSGRRFYKVQRSALATYDGGGGITYAAPTAATSAASAVGSSTATLNGTVNANGISTTVSFDYGTTTGYGSSVSASTLTGSTSTSVSAGISSLAVSTTYHCRVVATNSYGTTYGGDVTFTTSATGTFVAPTASTSAASGIATTSAVLNGTVNANGSSTTVTFEYGTTTSFGSTATATPSTVTGSSSTGVAVSVSGLTAGTTYYFRMKAVNAGGTTYGAQQTFTTSAASFGTIATVSPSSGSRSTTVTLTVALGTNPPAPPASNPPSAASLTGPSTITPTTTTRDSGTGVITMQVTIPAGAATGAYDVNATFGPNTWTKVAGFTVN
jgi:hypothetical protein